MPGPISKHPRKFLQETFINDIILEPLNCVSWSIVWQMLHFNILFQPLTIGHLLLILSWINKLVKYLKYHPIVLLSQLMVMLIHLVVTGFAWVNFPTSIELKQAKKQDCI